MKCSLFPLRFHPFAVLAAETAILALEPIDKGADGLRAKPSGGNGTVK
jgi:hypothetical protein